MSRGARGLCALALLCALGLAQPCGPGRTLRGTGTDARCCRSCAPAQDACPEPNCTCATPEFHCGDPGCSSCKHHPCPPGQRAQPHGKFVFDFDCVDCEPGRFSGGREGHCRPWADCSQLGFSTVFPGNRTHNAVCVPGFPPAAGRSGSSVALLAVAACILVLVGVQLSLHLWQLRRPHVWFPGSPLLQDAAAGRGPPADDSCSCQFPQEERGEQRPEDKGRLQNLWV
ncbi:tumor necrosis factor receptor superfamily member 18 [Sorex fumeus]|uniref:tumor necrosis factor receptor superfamily member 18 n=1 Tax=Sorex fumeus TaxID=62283 RepID=UPI0024ADCD5D|nr:tumor necrosis factor receptor superfamily member 18 [Sorex fumeus]